MSYRVLNAVKRPFAGLALATSLIMAGIAPAASEEVVTLRLHHFLSPAGPMSAYFEEWAQRLEQQSDGRLKVRLYPSMQLGGTPPSLFNQARDGQVDIVWTLTGFSPGRFPKAEVFDLPFMPGHPLATAQAAHEFYTRHLEDEFDGVHVMAFFTHSPGHIHTRNTLVKEPADLRRLKIRAPSRIMTQYIQEVGAVPVGMPGPTVAEALSRRVVDGTILPLEVMGAWRIQELAPNHTLFPRDRSLYTSTMFLAMNQARYDALPSDLQQVIDANSGTAEARRMAQVMLRADDVVLEEIKARGNGIHRIPEGELAAWQEPAQRVVDAWFARMEELGHDGQALYEEARSLIDEYTRQEP